MAKTQTDYHERHLSHQEALVKAVERCRESRSKLAAILPEIDTFLQQIEKKDGRYVLNAANGAANCLSDAVRQLEQAKRLLAE